MSQKRLTQQSSHKKSQHSMTLQDQQQFPQFQPQPEDNASHYSLHSYNSQNQQKLLEKRQGSRPITATQRSQIMLNQPSHDEHLPDINENNQRVSIIQQDLNNLQTRPASSKRSQQLQRSSQSQRIDNQALVEQQAVTATSQNGRQNLEQQAIPTQDLKARTMGSGSQRSDRLQDYDRRSNSKKLNSGSIPNDDIRQQIQTDSRPPVDLPPPIRNPFMQSSENFAQQNQNTRNFEIHQGMPDFQAAQIGLDGRELPGQRNSNRQGEGLKTQQPNASRTNQKFSSSGNVANILIRTQATKKKQKPHLNLFKEKNMNDKEVIDFLTDFCSTRVCLNNMTTPSDFDSTDNLDSFLMSLLQINQDNLTSIDNSGLENLHLATGTRTDYCRTLIQAIVEFQNKEVVFSDALEFFQESITKMIQVSSENQMRREQIEQLESAKQELTVKMFDYQKKLTETSTSLLKLRQTEFEQSKVLAAVKKQLDHKKAECESLTYMIKNNIKGNSDASPTKEPQSPSAESSIKNVIQKQQLDQSGPSLKNAEPVNIQTVQQPQQQTQPPQIEQIQLDEIPVPNQSNQILQQQIQKLQIENRQNLDRISDMQVAFDNKDRLISHLENNISEMLVEREKNVIRLKSEIVILQNKVTENDENLKQKLGDMRSRVEADEKAKVKRAQEKILEELDMAKRTNDDQVLKIKRLQDDYANLGLEFENYRKEKVLQENAREQYLKEIETKYKTLSEQYSEAQRSMINKLDAVTSQSLQKQNENEVLFLRLKYLKQITDTLKRQKTFLLESLSKSKEELEHSMTQLQESMINQNKSKSYLISVEKSIKQTKDMSELGTAALSNMENIVKFLKIEKMYELVFDVEQPTPWQDADIDLVQPKSKTLTSEQQETIKSQNSQSIKLEVIQPLRGSKESKNPGYIMKRDVAKVSQINYFMDQLKHNPEIPVQFKAKHESSTQQEIEVKDKKKKKEQVIVRNEEYFLEHCPVELCSILLKFIVQELCQIDAIQTVEQIPFSISRLLFLANSKSDLVVENELFDNYLFESKKIIDEELSHLIEQIQTLNKLKDMTPLKTAKGQSPQKVKNQGGENETPPDDSARKEKKKFNVLSLQAFEPKKSESEILPAAQVQIHAQNQQQQQQYEDLYKENQILKTELKQNQLTIIELKSRQKDVQIGLAGEIVELQEQIESLNLSNQEKLKESEQIFRQETEKIKQGCRLREDQLINQMHKLQEKLYETEQNFATQKQDLLEQNEENYNQQRRETNLVNTQEVSFVQHERFSDLAEKATKLLMSDELGTDLKQKRSLQNYIQSIEDESNKRVNEVQQRFDNYQANVQTFISVKESNCNTLSIVFDAEEANQAMINEQILKLYFQKIYNLPTEKFRMLSSVNFVREVESQVVSKIKKPADQVIMTKILLEVVEQADKLEVLSANLRAQINDGSSLLYDLLPAYVSFNLGISGMATKSKIQDCKLLQKCGLTIEGQEYIVTLLRHKTDPYVFMAIAINIQLGEEYVLELQQKDILTLIEGDISLLENPQDCQEVQSLILSNLVLCHDQIEQRKFLSCEFKVYFNTVMQANLSSKASSHAILKKKQDQEKFDTRKFEIGFQESPIKQSVYAKSTIRDNNLTQTMYQRGTNKQQNQFNYLTNQTRQDQQLQTDYQSSLLYENYTQIYSSCEKVSDSVQLKVQIDQASMSKTLKFSFTDSITQNSVTFCVLATVQNETAQSRMSRQNEESSESGAEEEGQDKVYNEQHQYFVHSQCLNIDDHHFILVCCERTQNQGISIKLHDLTKHTSVEIGLFQKSNGQMAKLQQSAFQSVKLSDGFRQMVQNLSFASVQPEDSHQSQSVLQSIYQEQDRLISESKDPQLAEQNLVQDLIPQHSITPQKLNSKAVVMAALKASSNPYARHSTNIESFKQLQERGLLLFRETQYIRVSHSLAQEEQPESQAQSQFPEFKDCKAVLALCSLHIKDQTITIEVLLYKNSKNCITSSINLQQLEDSWLFPQNRPLDLSHAHRHKIIKQMMEKLFVLEVQGRLEMKFEQDAPNISDLIAKYVEKYGGLPGKENEYQTKINQNKVNALRIHDEKTREFQIEKGGYVSSGRAVMFSEHVTIGEQSQVFELKIFVLLKKERKAQKTNTKRLNTFGKTQLQIETQKLEQHFDDYSEFESIYLETADPATKDLINLLIDKKRLVQILVRDMTTDWASLVINWRQKLIPYIKKCIQIDISAGKISLRNKTDISNLVIAHCQSLFGSKISQKDEQAILDTFKDECEELLEKSIVMQQEVDFAEYSYDIKLFRISKKSHLLDAYEYMGGVNTFSYHIEIFNIDDPEKVFKYRLPNSTEKANDPLSFIGEVFNLVHYESEKLEQQEGEASVTQTHVNEESKRNELMRKYINNNLILIVQQNKFPSLISLMLIESSSGLSWNCNYEPTTEITSAGSFCLLDVGTKEAFFNSVHDSLMPLDQQIYTSDNTNLKRIDWNKMEDSQPKQIVPVTDLDQTLSLSLVKHRGILKLSIFDREQKKQQLQQQKQQNNNKNDDDSADLQGEYADDLDILPPNNIITKVDVRIKNVFSSHLISKVLLTEQNKTALCLKLMTSEKAIQLTIQNLTTMAIIFNLRVEHQNDQSSSEKQIHGVTHLEQVHKHISDSIMCLNPKNIGKGMLQTYMEWQQHHQKSMRGDFTFSPTQKVLTLTRKICYDEQRENLVIVTAEIVVRKDSSTFDESLTLPHEVDTFVFRIDLPEKKVSQVQVKKLHELIDPAEYNVLNRSDIIKLKKVASNILKMQAFVDFDSFPYQLKFANNQ